MAGVFDTVLKDEGKNYLLPFLWLKGESHEKIGEEMEMIRLCGIREVCLESRPHPDFAGPQWWSDVDFIIGKAKALGMKIWILDDDHFPTGHAVGRFAGDAAALRKTYLAEQHADFTGGTMQAYAYRGMLEPDANVLAVLAVKRKDDDTTELDLAEVYDVTDGIRGNFCFFTIPQKGLYRVFTVYTTQENGGRKDYMNLIDMQSVRVLIDTVYEAHYERYADEFGKTILGFFSDEPELGNAPGYSFDNRLGVEGNKVPWSVELQKALEKRLGAGMYARLLACWFNIGAETESVRVAYMDEMTTLVHTCFSGQLGKWCKDHGVEYIGHIIEDDGASMNMGCSIGHYFREMKGEAIAGIDVVHHQIIPGHTGKRHQWNRYDGSGEFFHYQLAKLGSSSAHIDTEKKGRSLCEVFGNFGWGFDVPNMKWILDHMMVRGINHFVPHAFSITDPNPDCPPHFYAQGNNPQFAIFPDLMRYANRVCELISDGRALLDAAVLYPAKAYWTGKPCESLSGVCKELMTHQIDFNIVPEDFLTEAAVDAEEGTFGRTGDEYRVFVIPGGARIASEAAAFLQAHPEIPVLIAGEVPQADTDGRPFDIAHYPQITAVTLSGLSAACRPYIRRDFALQTSEKDLRLMRYRKDGRDLLYFFNEDVYETAAVTLTGDFAGVRVYDAVANTERWFKAEGVFRTDIPAGQVLFAELTEEPGTEKVTASREETVRTDWEVSIEKDSVFETLLKLTAADGFPHMNKDVCPGYCGTYRYKGNVPVEVPAGTRVFLDLPNCSNGAWVCVNSRRAGVVLSDEQKVEITDFLTKGRNELEICLPNTLVWQRTDRISAFVRIRQDGLAQAPKLIFEEG